MMMISFSPMTLSSRCEKANQNEKEGSVYSRELQRLYDHIVDLDPRRDPIKTQRMLDLFIIAIECIEDGNDERFLSHVRVAMDEARRGKLKENKS